MSHALNTVLVRDVIVEPKAGVMAKPTTLEAHHQAKMREFETTQSGASALEAELEETEDRLADIADIGGDEWRVLKDRVDALRTQIASIQSDEERLNYFLDVGDMLFQYYDAQESLAEGRGARRPAAPMRMPSNSVLSYFSGGSTSDIGAAVPVESTVPTPPRRAVSGSISAATAAAAAKPKASDIETDEGLNRDKLLERYLAVVEPSAIKSGIMPGSGIEPGWGSCPTCDVEMTFFQNEAMLSCPGCGYEEFILVDSEKPSYKDPPREITYFAYKKSNHFNEWLAQFQAKESTDIPQDVIEAVLSELRKERIRDPKRVKKEKIREILQKLKMSKMYDHVQQIKNRIQQQMTSLTLSKEVEEKLQHMFKEIQPAFIKYCPKGRSNFLSYPYVLYKMCQLLEMDEFLPCFQLLKSREKLYQQDQVWQQICRELGWQFIRSI
jgi:hypothetical protein